MWCYGSMVDQEDRVLLGCLWNLVRYRFESWIKNGFNHGSTGPCNVTPENVTEPNPYGWNNHLNMLYVKPVYPSTSITDSYVGSDSLISLSVSDFRTQNTTRSLLVYHPSLIEGYKSEFLVIEHHGRSSERHCGIHSHLLRVYPRLRRKTISYRWRIVRCMLCCLLFDWLFT